VLGRPIAHSLSPVLHRAAYRALALNWRYDAIDCDEAGLPGVIGARTGWAGFSCTMPLKRAVLAVADEVSHEAALIGAGNTLLPTADGGWLAANTDVTGVLDTLREGRVEPSTVTVLGAGGTAQATVAALAALGLERCSVLVRDPSRAGEVRAVGDCVGVLVGTELLDATSAALGADLVVSTLPPGAADPFAETPWRPGQTVLDVAYEPWPTALAAAAAQRGARVLSGARMLLHQAAAQVELMTGQLAPLDAMRHALRAVRPEAGL
jgi:shikimate dehydrogenase